MYYFLLSAASDSNGLLNAGFPEDCFILAILLSLRNCLGHALHTSHVRLQLQAGGKTCSCFWRAIPDSDVHFSVSWLTVFCLNEWVQECIQHGHQ